MRLAVLVPFIVMPLFADSQVEAELRHQVWTLEENLKRLEKDVKLLKEENESLKLRVVASMVSMGKA